MFNDVFVCDTGKLLINSAHHQRLDERGVFALGKGVFKGGFTLETGGGLFIMIKEGVLVSEKGVFTGVFALENAVLIA